MLFRKKTVPQPYPPERFEPLLKVSICNGETVACVRERTTGRLIELQALSAPADIRDFCRRFGTTEQDIKRVY